MRRWGALLLLSLLSCASAERPPETLPVLAALLGHADPARREEAAAQLAIRGVTVGETSDGGVPPPALRDTASLRAGLQQTFSEPEDQVRNSWHVLRRGCLARDSKRVGAALIAQGFQLTEIYEPNERVKFTRYLAQPSAYVNPAGDRHDLFCWTQAVRRADSSWIIREVYAGFHVSFDAAFKTISAADRYPRGSVLGSFLSLSDLQKVAAVFPLLEEIEFTYGRIRTRDADSHPAGFHVNAGFAMEGKAGGRSVYYTAESGMDPLESRGGRLEWDGFTPSGTVGPLIPRGSGIWGAGGLKPTEDYY